MRIIFMGTPDFAVPTLDALADAGHDILAVYTQPPRPAGRGKAPRPSSMQRRAEERGLSICYPVSLKGADEQASFAALGADIAIVAAYGLILPRAILGAPINGCLNVHASLLPRWRGAAPVQRAILAGDTETGVTIMQMEAGLDTGPMLAETRTTCMGKTAGELTDELAHIGADLLVRILADLPAYPPVIQPSEGITYAAKIDKGEARIAFAAGPDAVERQIRAFNPSPGAWTAMGDERLKLLGCVIEPTPGIAGMVLDDALLIGCGTAGSIRPTLVQRAGKGAMAPADLLRGFPIPAGTQLT